jgi:hypothetical protein
VNATAIGDRIQLESTDTTKSGPQVTASVANAIGSGAALTTLAQLSRSTFLDTTSFGLRGYEFTGTSLLNSVLSVNITKTNGSAVFIAVTNSSGPLSLIDFTIQLIDAINTHPALQAADGLAAEDFSASGGIPRFNLRARTAGWPAAKIAADFNASGGPSVTPSTNLELTEQLSDLRPRNHLYLTAGTTNATINFPLVTTNFPDGFHELTAVAYEGSHVWTQTRATIPVVIQNHALTASLVASNADLATAIEGNFSLNVTANTPNIASIELIGPGGRVGIVSNAATASFTIATTNFGLGRLQFFALVTDTDGHQFRTAKFVTRAVAAEKEIPLQITGPAPVRLLWPGVAGRFYDILTAEQLSNSYVPAVSWLASNSVQNVWTDPLATNAAQRFYKIRVSP